MSSSLSKLVDNLSEGIHNNNVLIVNLISITFGSLRQGLVL